LNPSTPPPSGYATARSHGQLVTKIWATSRPCDELTGTLNNKTRGRPNLGFGFGFGAECGQMGTFGGHSVSADSSCYHIRCTFGFGVLQLVNSMVAETRVQSLTLTLTLNLMNTVAAECMNIHELRRQRMRQTQGVISLTVY